MSRCGIAMIVALALSSWPAAAQSTSLDELQSNIEGKWTLGPSQAGNQWRCADSPVLVTFSIDFKRNQTIATFLNWQAQGRETVFNLMQVISAVKVSDVDPEAPPISLVLTPDEPGHPRMTRESRYFRKVSEDVFVWGSMLSNDDRPMVFTRCPAS